MANIKIISDNSLTFREKKFLLRVFHTQNSYKYMGINPLEGYYYARFDVRAIQFLLGRNYKKPLMKLQKMGYLERMYDRRDHHGNYIIKIRGTEKLENSKKIFVNERELREDKTYRQYKRSVAYYFNHIKSDDRYEQAAIAINETAKTIQKTTLNITEQDIVNLYEEKFHEEKRNITKEEYVKLGVNLYRRFMELKQVNDVEEIKEYISVSEFGKRLFHPLISFIKKVRKYILIEGEETVSIDIKTSQVIFLAKLLSDMGDYNLSSMIKDGVDVYDLIAEYENISRKKAKKLFFFMIFGWTKKYSKTFERIFKRKSLENINYLKFNRLNIKSIKKSYTNLVYKLQEVESSFTIRNTVFYFKKLGVSFLPIHDEFIVKKSDLNKALHALRKCSGDFDPSGEFLRMIKFEIS